MALANIYSDPNYHNQNHCGILQALARKGVYLAEPNNTQLTETILIQNSPLKMVRREIFFSKKKRVSKNRIRSVAVFSVRSYGCDRGPDGVVREGSGDGRSSGVGDPAFRSPGGGGGAGGPREGPPPVDQSRVARAHRQDPGGGGRRRQDAAPRAARCQGFPIVVRRRGPGSGRRLLLPRRAQLDGHQGVEETLGRRRAAQLVAGPRLL